MPYSNLDRAQTIVDPMDLDRLLARLRRQSKPLKKGAYRIASLICAALPMEKQGPFPSEDGDAAQRRAPWLSERKFRRDPGQVARKLLKELVFLQGALRHRDLSLWLYR